MAPADFTAGVIVYEHPAYMGASGHFSRDLPDLSLFEGPCTESDFSAETGERKVWNDCISSIRLAPGWRATLYIRTHFRDAQLEVRQDVSDLRSVIGPCDRGGGFNDCISSIRVFYEGAAVPRPPARYAAYLKGEGNGGA
jgi:hypothetical protein